MKRQITNLIKAFILLVACTAITNSSKAQVWTIGGVHQERVVGQIPTTAKSGFVNIATLRINVTGIGTTSGTNMPLTFNGFSCAITGTNTADIAGAKIYFTTNSNPSVSDILYSKGTISVGSAVINDNVVENITLSGFANGELNFAGIRVENSFLDWYLYNNKIRNISLLSSANGRCKVCCWGRETTQIFMFSII